VNVSTQDSRVQRLVDQRFAYVAVSRAESDAQIYTDNAERLAQALGQKQDKTQALRPEEVQTYREQAIQIRTNQRAFGQPFSSRVNALSRCSTRDRLNQETP
jgi:hypothetical protein